MKIKLNCPKQGDKKIVKKFLFLPRMHNCSIYWLEKVKITKKYHVWSMASEWETMKIKSI